MSTGADCPVAVFSRAPVPGRVKTRLVPALGSAGAAKLQARLTHSAIQTALEAGIGPVELWCDPDCADDFFVQCERRYRLRLRPQGNGDLGERMSRAFSTLLAAFGRAILIGSDIPAMNADYLREAEAVLRGGYDAVIGPAEDGGYVLIGLARPAPQLFQGMQWGGTQVMDATRARMGETGVRFQELPVLWDVDRPGDLRRMQYP